MTGIRTPDDSVDNIVGDWETGLVLLLIEYTLTREYIVE